LTDDGIPKSPVAICGKGCRTGSAPDWFSLGSRSARGVVNDALTIYFLDVTIASAFVARWCAAQKVEILDGVYRFGMTDLCGCPSNYKGRRLT
jgi:hypothetical protein